MVNTPTAPAPLFATPLSTVVMVAGLRDHVEQHWQTLLAHTLARSRPVLCVPPLREDGLSCRARVQAIEDTVKAVNGPLLFVAHSAGVIMLQHWAQTCQHEVQGALLAAPPDFETPLPAGYPGMDTLRANGWLPVPNTPLPFPSLVAASTNDPLASYTRVQDMARRWGSTLVNLGAVGHLNPASGFGPWPQAQALLQQLSGF